MIAMARATAPVKRLRRCTLGTADVPALAKCPLYLSGGLHALGAGVGLLGVIPPNWHRDGTGVPCGATGGACGSSVLHIMEGGAGVAVGAEESKSS